MMDRRVQTAALIGLLCIACSVPKTAAFSPSDRPKATWLRNLGIGCDLPGTILNTLPVGADNCWHECRKEFHCTGPVWSIKGPVCKLKMGQLSVNQSIAVPVTQGNNCAIKRIYNGVVYIGNEAKDCDFDSPRSQHLESIEDVESSDCNEKCRVNPRCTHHRWVARSETAPAMCVLKTGDVKEYEIKQVDPRVGATCFVKVTDNEKLTVRGTNFEEDETFLSCDLFMDGKVCGCWKGWCWSYIDTAGRQGSPWCFTQTVGEPRGRGLYQACTTNATCSWSMTCGSEKSYVGVDATGLPKSQLGPVSSHHTGTSSVSGGKLVAVFSNEDTVFTPTAPPRKVHGGILDGLLGG